MKKKILYFILGVIILILSVGIFLLIKLGVLNNILGTELGWIPIGEQGDSLTNPITTDLPHLGSCDAYIGDEITSKYWNLKIKDTKTSCNSYYQDTSSYSGGDTKLILKTTSLRSYPSGSVTAQLNENLYTKHFKIDYALTGCNEGCNFKAFGELVSSGKSSGTIELIPSVINECSTLEINGKKIKEICGTEIYAIFTMSSARKSGYDNPTTLILSSPRYKPLFDCKIDNDEVLIFDEFSESSFDINSLSYPVQKFCINQPAVIRSLTDRGIAVDSDGEILITLSEGGSVKVKADQTIRVPYITKTQIGLLRCSTGQAYSTKENKCVEILGEGEEDIEPSVSSQLTDIGENEILGYDSIEVGDLNIIAEEPNLVCTCSDYGSVAGFGETEDSCWKTTINNIEFYKGDTKNLNNYITITYDISGIGYSCTKGWEENSYTNVLKLTINQDALKISPKDSIGIVKQNSEVKLKFNIENNLANFQSYNSGYLVKNVKKIIDETSSKFVEQSFTKGTVDYLILLDTDKLGDVETTITPYIVINGKKIYGSNSLIVNYKVEENPTQEDIEGNSKPPVTSDSKVKTKLITWIAISLIIIFIIIILYFILRKSKRRK